MPRAAPRIELSQGSEAALRRVVRAPSSTPQEALRARIVLRAAEGATNREIAEETGASLPTVGLWRRNFAERGHAGLRDRPRSGRPRTVDDDQVKRVLATMLKPPPDGTTRWSVRRLAEATGLSATTVHRIWCDYNVSPPEAARFALPKQPALVQVVGIHLQPPHGALVLSLEEDARLDEADFVEPSQPIRRGQLEGLHHEDRDDGSRSIDASPEVPTAQVSGRGKEHHRQDFLAFLSRLVRAYPSIPLHVVLDNCPAYTAPEVERWVAHHKRVQFHFTPPGASWTGLIRSASRAWPAGAYGRAPTAVPPG